MKIAARFRRLTLWNKLATIGSIVTIVGFIVSLYIGFHENDSTNKVIVEYPLLSIEQIGILEKHSSGPSFDQQTQQRLIKNLLDQVDSQQYTIVKLENHVDEQKKKIDTLLKNDSKSGEIKVANFVDGIRAPKIQVYQSYEEQVKNEENLLDADLKTYGEDHSKVAIRRNNLGDTHFAFGQYKKAIDYYQQALASLEKTSNHQHPYVKSAKINLELAKAKLAEQKP